jgi:hypothetical protein
MQKKRYEMKQLLQKTSTSLGIAFLVIMLSACTDGMEPSTPSAGRAMGSDTVAHAYIEQVASIPTDEDCASIAAWVAEHAGSLPTEYEALALYPIAYRRAIFHASSPAIRSNLWQQHFARYLVTHPGLSPQQVTFVKEARSKMSPTLFVNEEDMASSQELTALVREMESGAIALFPEIERYELLANLGPVVPSGPSTEGIPCECSRASDWCWNRGAGYGCYVVGCDYLHWGCGTFWAFPCDGLCYR